MHDDDFTPSADHFLARNAEWVAEFEPRGLPVSPGRRVAIVACMDSRMPLFPILGLDRGDAHLIRNAGGVVTDDVIRSLTLSQRALGTREIILVHHTDCGLQKVTEDGFTADIESDIGVRPPWRVEAFTDPYADTKQSIQRLLNSPFIAHKDHIRGFVYDVGNGRLDEVTVD
ncbi:MAG: carbonic anhydrase [Acidimicrobiales bacterium]|nr:carbonic anhydrase [Acidimicrobiales bacterium]